MRNKVAEVVTPPDWHKQGLCAYTPNPELWSYDTTMYEDEKFLYVLHSVEAIEICNDCPVKNLCLKQGLEQQNLHAGTIWGGLLAIERAQLKGVRLNYKVRKAETIHQKKVRKRIPR